jgi:Holliday junction resolvase
MNRRYIKGRNFEYRVKKYFEDKKYFVVRSAGSKGIADLVAIYRNNPPKQRLPLIIQCKNMSYRRVPKKEVRRFLDFASKYWCVPVVATKRGRKLVLLEGEDALRDFLLAKKTFVAGRLER